ncbi:MAG TPA: class II aldolase/adducin family protein [Phycisphaerae bacterium]|nr:class II aldolase/adducin family protein [Phycisphaerae bacterium]
MTDEKTLREQVCEIGRRLYARCFVAGNAGNLSCRMAADRVLCTPTLISKGFMQPDDLCVIDLEGKRLSGERRPTSELALHLEVYRTEPGARGVVHCHPPHALAFAIAREDIPTGVLPEIEVFLGEVPRADYETPGGDAFAAMIRPYIGRANTVVLSNHGTVSWGPTLERACWNTEAVDAYCHALILAKLVGNVERLPEAKVAELLDLRPRMGEGPDPRRTAGGSLLVNPEFGKRPPAD